MRPSSSTARDRKLGAHRGNPYDVALFLLSGGTTGMPKLIPRTHADYLYNARGAAEVCALTSESRILLALPAEHNFPLACPGLVGGMLTGATGIFSQSTRLKISRRLFIAKRSRICHASPRSRSPFQISPKRRAKCCARCASLPSADKGSRSRRRGCFTNNIRGSRFSRFLEWRKDCFATRTSMTRLKSHAPPKAARSLPPMRSKLSMAQAIQCARAKSARHRRGSHCGRADQGPEMDPRSRSRLVEQAAVGKGG